MNDNGSAYWRSLDELAFLLANDTDPFNRWEAGRTLTKDLLLRMVTEGAGPGL